MTKKLLLKRVYTVLRRKGIDVKQEKSFVEQMNNKDLEHYLEVIDF